MNPTNRRSRRCVLILVVFGISFLLVRWYWKTGKVPITPTATVTSVCDGDCIPSTSTAEPFYVILPGSALDKVREELLNDNALDNVPTELLKDYALDNIRQELMKDNALNNVRQELMKDNALDNVRQELMKDNALGNFRTELLKDNGLYNVRKELLKDYALDNIPQELLKDNALDKARELLKDSSNVRPPVEYEVQEMREFNVVEIDQDNDVSKTTTTPASNNIVELPLEPKKLGDGNEIKDVNPHTEILHEKETHMNLAALEWDANTTPVYIMLYDTTFEIDLDNLDKPVFQYDEYPLKM